MALTQINKAGLDELALDHVFTIGASGSSAYTFQGEGLNGTVNNPTLYLTRGKTYRFENGSGGHPIRIQSTSGASGTAYNTGVTNNAGSGTVIVEVQHDAPDVLYYQCTSHAAMNGVLYITGALADGGVTTAKLADDAVTDAKLANSINSAIAANTAKSTNATHTGDVTGSGSLTIANNAVTTAKIADEAVTLAKLPHGDGSSNGKFLRANNGADPTFETVNTDLVSDTSPQLGGALASNGHNILFADGDSAKFGTSGDAAIFHNDTDFHLDGEVSGATRNIYITGGSVAEKVIELRSKDNEPHVRCYGDGAVELYHDNVKRIATNSSSYKGAKIHGDASNTSIAMQTVSTARGYLYANNSDEIGLLDAGGDWAIKHTNDVSTEFRVGTAVKATVNTHGLTFNGDTAATNALDDYEEGTYAPTLGSVGTTTSFTTYSNEQSLSYHKIGNMVTIHGRLRFQTTNFSGEAYLSLPFAAAAGSNTDNSGCSAVAFHGVDINGHIGLFIETSHNSSTAWFLIARDDTSWTGATSSNLKSGSYVTFVHTYRAA
jgi:hypothetical protein